MTWARRLKHVFGSDTETGQTCGGAVWVIPCFEDPAVIEKILTRRVRRGRVSEASLRLPSRALPQRGLWHVAG